MTKLRNCPFCGSDYMYGIISDGFTVRCPACGANIKRDNREDAYAAWNERNEPICTMDIDVDEMFEAEPRYPFKCSNCGYVHLGRFNPAFCPNCGFRVVDGDAS